MAYTLRTGEPYAMELSTSAPTGQTGWLQSPWRGAVRGESGEVTKLIGSVHEVTARHQAEEARIQASAIESASRNKTQLMSRVSHEPGARR